MNHPLEKLYQESTHIKLSSNEKHTMHARLLQAMDASLSAAPAAASRPTKGLYYFMSPQFAMPLAALLVVMLGTTTVYAAEGALPGDPLYVIKTKVSEPIQGALAFSTEDKIQFHSSVAQTRLEEAEVLASQNRLDATVTLELASNIDKHIAERQELADQLDEEKPGHGSELLARSGTSIAAHSDILVALGSESANRNVKEHSDSIAMSARGSHGRSGSASGTMLAMAAPTAPQPKIATMSMTLEAEDSAATDSPEATSTHERTKNAGDVSAQHASTTAAALRVRIEKLTMLDQELRAKLEERLAKIDTLIAEGNSDEALDRMVTLSAFISAGVQFDKGILKNLLGHDSHWGEDQ